MIVPPCGQESLGPQSTGKRCPGSQPRYVAISSADNYRVSIVLQPDAPLCLTLWLSTDQTDPVGLPPNHREYEDRPATLDNPSDKTRDWKATNISPENTCLRAAGPLV